MKNSEFNNKNKNKYGNLKTILSICLSSARDGILMKHKSRLCVHGGMKQYGVNYWENYSPVVNRIIVRSLLDMANINELPSVSIDFVLASNQDDLDVDVFM